MIQRPTRRRLHDVVRGTLPTLGGHDFQRMQHRVAVMHGNKSHSGGPVLVAGEDCGFRACRAVHHRNPGRSDAAFGPQIARDGQRRPVGKGGHAGRCGQVGNGAGIDGDGIDDAVAVRGKGRVQRRIPGADQKQPILTQAPHRRFGQWQVGVGPFSFDSRRGYPFAATRPVANHPGSDALHGRRGPCGLHHRKNVGGGHPNRAERRVIAASRRAASDPRTTRLVPKLPFWLNG